MKKQEKLEKEANKPKKDKKDKNNEKLSIFDPKTKKYLSRAE